MQVGETLRLDVDRDRTVAVHNRGDVTVVTVEWDDDIATGLRDTSIGVGLTAEQARQIGAALIAAADAMPHP